MATKPLQAKYQGPQFGVAPVGNVYVSTGPARGFAQAADTLNKIGGVMADDLDREAVRQGRREGVAAGATGVPALRDNNTLSGGAFNDSALATYANKIEIAARGKMIELSEKHKADPIGFAKAAEGYKVGVMQEMSSLTPEIGALFGAQFEVMQQGVMSKIVANKADLIADDQKATALTLFNTLGKDLANTAPQLMSGDIAQSTAAFENIAMSRERLDTILNQQRSDGMPLFKATERAKMLIDFEDSMLETAVRGYVDAAPDKAAAYKALKDGTLRIRTNVLNDDGQVAVAELDPMGGLSREKREASLGYAQRAETDEYMRGERGRMLQERQDTITRARVVNQFQEFLAGDLAKLKVEKDMADDTVTTGFMERADAQMRTTLENHTGSPESKAHLEIQLNDLRTRTALDVGQLSSLAKKKTAMMKIDADVRALATDVLRDPAKLGDAFNLLDETISRTGSAFISHEEEEQARIGGRQELTVQALNAHLSKGDIRGMRQLLSVPGIQEGLEPALQRQYTDAISKYDIKQNEWMDEANKAIKKAELIKGAPLTLTERLKVAGLGEQGQQDFTAEGGLRREFTAQAGDFVKVRDSFGRIAASKESAAGDMALIFNFMKMLDPGSTVREGEQASAQNAAGVPDQVRNVWNKLMTGERLAPAQRTDFKGQAESLFKSALDQHLQLEEQYSGLATRNSLKPENVVTDLVGPLRAVGKGKGTAKGGGTDGGAGGVIELDMQGNVIGGGAAKPKPAAAPEN